MTGTTGDNGILSLGDLGIGEYRLLETDAPAGYDWPAQAILITVSANAVTAKQDGRDAEVVQKGDRNGYWVPGQDDATWQIRVWNTCGSELPEIGGIGSHWFYLAGGVLLPGAAGWTIRRKKHGTLCSGV